MTYRSDVLHARKETAFVCNRDENETGDAGSNGLMS